MFDFFVGKEVFNRIKTLGKTNGVYLFVSNNKNYLREAAQIFAENLLSFSEKDRVLNEKIFSTEQNYISVELINDFIDFEAKKAVSVKSKILIMHDIELLQKNVADKLLKTVEDFNKDSLIIFTTTNLSGVLNTIRSRCMVYKSNMEEEDYFITYRNKYLSFIEKLEDTPEDRLDEILLDMTNLGVLNIIKALWVNSVKKEWLDIAESAYKIYNSTVKEESLLKYILYRFFLLREDKI